MVKTLFQFVCVFCERCRVMRMLTVAKSTSLFTEQSAGPEIQRLIVEVNRDIQRMTNELDTLQADVKARSNGTKSQDTDHHNNVVSYLKSQVGQTTAMFKDVLQARTDVCFSTWVQLLVSA